MESESKIERLEALLGDLKSDERFGKLVAESYLFEAIKFYIEAEDTPALVDFVVGVLREKQQVKATTGVSRTKSVTLKDGDTVERYGFELRREGGDFVLRYPSGRTEVHKSLTSAAQKVQEIRGFDGKVSGPRFWGLEAENS